MLALSLLLLLCMELWLWLALGHNLFQSGHGVWLAVGLPVLLAVGWRALLVVAGFLVSGVWRRAAAGDLRQRWRACGGEFWAQLKLYTWIQPLLALERRPRQDSNPLPVVLVHGFLCNAGLWGGFIARLRKRGVDAVYAVNLDPLYRDMQRSLQVFERKLERILERCGARSAILVGHSMGGVLVRLYRDRNPQRVAAACCIAAPHHGTLGARLIGGGRELGPPSPSSRWLQQFNAGCSSDAGLLNIWSEADNIVWPQDSAQLDPVTDLKLGGYGHLHLLAAPAVLDAVAALVLTARAERSAGAATLAASDRPGADRRPGHPPSDRQQDAAPAGPSGHPPSRPHHGQAAASPIQEQDA